jgi:hypothetical protein
MRILRLSILLAASMVLVACGTMNKMISTFRRALHVHSETTESPDHFRPGGHDVRESLAGGARIDVNPQDAPPELAKR